MRLDQIVWKWAYTLEELRNHHASYRNLWRQAGCCILLALLRIAGNY